MTDGHFVYCLWVENRFRFGDSRGGQCVDAVLDDLEAIARRCERAAKRFDEEPLASMIGRLTDASYDVGRSSSQSWLGYQSTVYLDGFRPAAGGEHFDSEWGELGFPSRTRGRWVYTEYQDVMTEIQRRANVPDLKPIDDAAEAADEVFNRSRSQL